VGNTEAPIDSPLIAT